MTAADNFLSRISRKLRKGLHLPGRGPASGGPSAEGENVHRDFRVEAPWRLDHEAVISVTLENGRLVGSDRHMIRLDLYPLIAASHGNRHHGFWDVPLGTMRSRRVDLIFSDGGVIASSGGRSQSINPVWKGDLDFSGYAMLHVSLWDFGQDPPNQLSVVSSQHMLGDEMMLSLDQVTMPVTQRCNLTCPMCMRHNPSSFDASDISSDVLDPVLEAASRIPSFILTGVGETLLNPRLEEIIRKFRQRMPGDGKVSITTNAMLFSRDRCASIMDAGITSVCFSVDGATRETYEPIRPGAIFDTVIRNIAAAVEHVRSTGRGDVTLTTNFVMQPQNIHEIPAFVRLASSLGIKVVKFSHYRDFKSGEFRILDEAQLQTLFDEAKKAARASGIWLSLPRIRPLADSRCEFMQMTYLWLSGDVVPCCRMLPGASPIPARFFGNVREQGLLDIWESTAYKEFRHNVLAGRYPDVCKKCNYAVGLLN